MKVEQALIAVGGRASRLRGEGVDVPVTKSFLEVEGKPLLSWCLTSLCLAGIKRVVLAGNEREHLQHANNPIATGYQNELHVVARGFEHELYKFTLTSSGWSQAERLQAGAVFEG